MGANRLSHGSWGSSYRDVQKRTAWIVGIAILVAGPASGVPLGPSTNAQAQARCSPSGTVVARTSRVLIFKRGGPGTPSSNPQYYGCLPRGRIVRLSLPDEFGVIVDTVRVAGRFVALDQNRGTATDLGTCDQVVIRSAGGGRPRFVGPETCNGDAGDLVLKPNGSAAFLYGRGPTEVHVVSRGRDSVVDRGRIAARSLALTFNRRFITYVKDGRTRSRRIR